MLGLLIGLILVIGFAVMATATVIVLYSISVYCYHTMRSATPPDAQQLAIRSIVRGVKSVYVWGKVYRNGINIVQATPVWHPHNVTEPTLAISVFDKHTEETDESRPMISNSVSPVAALYFVLDPDNRTGGNGAPRVDTLPIDFVGFGTQRVNGFTVEILDCTNGSTFKRPTGRNVVSVIKYRGISGKTFVEVAHLDNALVVVLPE